MPETTSDNFHKLRDTTRGFFAVVSHFMIFLAFSVAGQAQPTPQIILVSPIQNELNVSVSSSISVTFDVYMDETTINSSTFLVNARSTGLHAGTISYDGPSKTATFNPVDDFAEGEVVTVSLTTGVQSYDGTPLEDGYQWSFTSVVDDGSGNYDPQSVYSTGDGPLSVFSADLDGDGDLDLAAANGGSGNVSVLLNNGDGTFAAQSVYAVGNYSFSIFSADLDGDGDLDLATANYASDDVSVLLNNGDGTFAPQSLYPVGSHPASVFSADLDGDGDLDLATANDGSDNVSALLNIGDGTFQAAVNYGAGTSPQSVFAADVDGDGDLDLATANYGGFQVSILLNNGDGTFAAASGHGASNAISYSVFAADLDGDGDIDLATANAGYDNVTVLLNNGDGSYPWVHYPVGSGPRSVFAADLDADGDLDLAATNWDAGTLSVLPNNGDGTFASQVVYALGDFPHSVFSADLDGDGDLDLAVTNSGSDNVSVLLNKAQPHIVSTAPAQNELNVPVSSTISVTFDVDIDETTINSSIFKVNARSTGLHAGTISYDGPSRTATFDPAEDFDEGEVVTVALTTGIASSEGVPLECAYAWSFTSAVDDGSGTFAPQSVYPAGDTPTSLFSADLDGDGDLDLATANYEGSQVSILLNNGDGTFAAASGHGALDATSFSVFAADLDGDGDVDLATANFTYNNVTVLLNNGDGSYARVHYPVGSRPLSVFATDLDGDGDLDLATANYGGSQVSILLNNGDVDGSGGAPSPLDVTFLVNKVYKSQDALCQDRCNGTPGNCPGP